MNDPISAMNALNYVASIKKLFSDVEKWSKPITVQEVNVDDYWQ